MDNCDRRFATPTEQRTHEALHRIRNLGIIPNMPAFAPPIANNPTPAPPVQETVTVEESVAEEVKSDGKPDDADLSAFPDDVDRPEDQDETNLAIAMQKSIDDQLEQANAEEEAQRAEAEEIARIEEEKEERGKQAADPSEPTPEGNL